MTKKISLIIVSEWTIFSATLGITYYANVVNVGTTVTAHIYSDAAHTTQVGTASLCMGNKTCADPVDRAYNTLIAGSSRDDGSSTTSVIDGYIENLKIISVG